MTPWEVIEKENYVPLKLSSQIASELNLPAYLVFFPPKTFALHFLHRKELVTHCLLFAPVEIFIESSCVVGCMVSEDIVQGVMGLTSGGGVICTRLI